MTAIASPPPSPDTYWATVDPRFLEKVDRVFDASPTTVWNELLQNARRAGATKVSVTLNALSERSVAVRFEDDGSGLENPEPLLRLAGRGWDDSIEHSEDPAGMGFFCLSNFNYVTVRSRHWGTRMTPGVFRGTQGAHRDDCDEYVTGVALEWEWEGEDTNTLDGYLCSAAEFCGLQEVEIYIDGVLRSTIVPKDFLASCTTVRDLPQLGLRIGAEYDSRGDYYGGGTPKITLNFRGVSLRWVGHEMGEHLNLLSRAYVHIKVDVMHTRVLQLVLPARNAVKHNAGRAALLEECERMAYEWIVSQAQKKHNPVKHYLPYSVYRRAMDKFNIDIGEAEFHLTTFLSSYSTCARKVLVDIELTMWEQLDQILCYHNSSVEFGSPDYMMVYDQSKDMVGYSWYDSMPVINNLFVKVDGNDIPLSDFSENQWDNTTKDCFEFVDTLEVEMHISDGRIYKHSPPVLIAGDGKYSYVEELDQSVRIYISRAALEDMRVMHEIAFILDECLFSASSESEDSESEQRAAFTKDIVAWMLKICGHKKQAIRHVLKAELGKIGYEVQSNSLTWTVRFDGRRKNDEDFRGLEIVSFQYSQDEEANHKFLCASPRGQSDWIEELVSESEITHERVAAYLQVEHEFDEDDGWVLDSAGPVIDLDKWEKENQEKLAKLEDDAEE